MAEDEVGTGGTFAEVDGVIFDDVVGSLLRNQFEEFREGVLCRVQDICVVHDGEKVYSEMMSLCSPGEAS